MLKRIKGSTGVNIYDADILLLIKTNYASLSKGQKQVADYVLKNTSAVMLSSIAALAKECKVSEATIMRFLRKIGYDSYQVFRVKLAQIYSGKHDNIYNEEIQNEDSNETVVKKVIADTGTAIQQLLTLNSTSLYLEAVNAILAAKKICIFGAGSSGYVAGDLHHKLLRFGLNAITSEDSHIQAIHCVHVDKDDLLILISHSGETLSLIDCLQNAIHLGAKVISITSFPKSSLANKSDLTLLSCSNETKFRPDAQKSRILQVVITDILTVFIAARLKEQGKKNVYSSQLAVAKMKK